MKQIRKYWIYIVKHYIEFLKIMKWHFFLRWKGTEQVNIIYTVHQSIAHQFMQQQKRNPFKACLISSKYIQRD